MLERVSFLSLIAILLSSAAAAQEGQYSERVDVNVVNVDVLVTDKAGAPANGLSQSAFNLTEDNKKVKITSFSADGPVSADTFPSIVVYVDDTHITKHNRDSVLEVLSKHVVERVRSTGTAALVARFDGLTEVLLDFTTDADAVEEAFVALAARDPSPSESALLGRDARRSFEENRRASRGATEVQAMLRNIRGYGESLQRDTTRSLGAMTELAGSIGHRPGRKAFYLVADGLAQRPLGEMMATLQRQLSRASGGSRYATGADASEGEQLRSRMDQDTGSGVGEEGVSRMQRDMEPMLTTADFELLAGVANASQITFYPIRPPFLDAASTGIGNETGDRRSAVSDLREGPELIASSTGGQAFVAGNDVGGYLDRTAEGNAALYSLTFTPAEHPEGSLHLLKLKLKGKGLDYRYRQSYVMKTASSKLADRTIGAATLGWVENPHGLETTIDSQTEAGDGNFDVALMVGIPIGELALNEQNGVHTTNCRVALLVMLQDGRLTKPQFMDVVLPIQGSQLEAARKQLFGAKAGLRLPPGSHQLAVGLWDELSQKGSFIAQPIDVGGA